MGYRKVEEDPSEMVMEQLADSVLGLSDEAILAEAGAAADEEAERTRLVLRRMSQSWDFQERGDENVRIIPIHKSCPLKR